MVLDVQCWDKTIKEAQKNMQNQFHEMTSCAKVNGIF
jgi:hypothetical protein